MSRNCEKSTVAASSRTAGGASAGLRITVHAGGAHEPTAPGPADDGRKKGSALVVVVQQDCGSGANLQRAREQGARIFELRAAQSLDGLADRSPAAVALIEETRVRLTGKLDDPGLASLGPPRA